MDGGPSDHLGSGASLKGHRAGGNKLVQSGGEDVPGARVLDRIAAGRLDRQERRGEQVRLLLSEVDVAAPDRLEPSDRPHPRIGLVDPFDRVEHPPGEVPSSHFGDLAEKSVTVRKVAVDRGRRNSEAPIPLIRPLLDQSGDRWPLHAARSACDIPPQIAGRDDRTPRLGLVQGTAFTVAGAPWAGLVSVRRADNHLFLRYRIVR